MFLFPLFYVIREFHRFLHRGKAKKMKHCAQVLPGGGGVGALGREGNTVHVLNFSKFCGCFHHPQNNLSQKNIIGKIYMTVMANCVLPRGETLSSLSFRNKMTTFETKC